MSLQVCVSIHENGTFYDLLFLGGQLYLLADHVGVKRAPEEDRVDLAVADPALLIPLFVHLPLYGSWHVQFVAYHSREGQVSVKFVCALAIFVVHIGMFLQSLLLMIE